MSNTVVANSLAFSSASHEPTESTVFDLWIKPRHEKNLSMTYANNKDADQPAHSRSLISTHMEKKTTTTTKNGYNVL